MSSILKNQLNRVRENICAFILLGMLSGFIVGGEDYLSDLKYLNSLLSLLDVQIDYKELGSSFMFEHFAPNSLVLILVFAFFFSSLHRIFHGAIRTEKVEEKGIIYSLVNFGSLLAIAWLGIMLGISFPALIFDGWKVSLSFWILSIYPVLFLIEISCCQLIMYWEGLSERPVFKEDMKAWARKTSLEGIAILVLAFVVLIGMEKHQTFIDLIVSRLRSAL
ncbi:hypothetical protein [Vibrio splendidus]|uniref:hypothetical protein n=1 Tax=Vibrio splendidus TaxID=29497 RepID=UPI0011B29166|nr:hypothetical protein [Vibrio splendidus]